jgi:RNA polymerase sigma factor (sigma-70 family)
LVRRLSIEDAAMYVSAQTSDSTISNNTLTDSASEAPSDGCCEVFTPSCDPDWLDKLYTAAYPAAISHARRLIGAADADDLVQEAFLRVARYRPRTDTGSITVGFIVTVVRNLARSWIVQRKRAQVAGRDLMLACSEHEEPATRDGWLDERLRVLSDGQRDAFVLVDVLGLSEAQAGLAMSISRPVVSVKRRSALATLRERCEV